MGILRTGAAVAFSTAGTACYAPELRDCTLTCNAESDCAPGQICGPDHLCATPEIAGRCRELPGDAGPHDRDAGADDAKLPDAPPDTATHTTLATNIEGKGRITVQGIGTCDETEPQNGSCVFVVPLDLAVTVEATAYPDWYFDRWTTAVCAVVPDQTCTFVPRGPTSVGAKFRKGDDD